MQRRGVLLCLAPPAFTSAARGEACPRLAAPLVVAPARYDLHRVPSKLAVPPTHPCRAPLPSKVPVPPTLTNALPAQRAHRRRHLPATGHLLPIPHGEAVPCLLLSARFSRWVQLRASAPEQAPPEARLLAARGAAGACRAQQHRSSQSCTRPSCLPDPAFSRWCMLCLLRVPGAPPPSTPSSHRRCALQYTKVHRPRGLVRAYM